MEDTLREANQRRYGRKETVLILILMEDTLRVMANGIVIEGVSSLNPYSNGRYSERTEKVLYNCQKEKRLNPYSNGRYSERYLIFNEGKLMGCLNPYSNGRYSER